MGGGMVVCNDAEDLMTYHRIAVDLRPRDAKIEDKPNAAIAITRPNLWGWFRLP
jgi:hypothetical protein